jgi:DNA mismatch repair protein MutS
MNPTKHINTLLQDKNRSLIEVYFDIQDYFEKLYGSNTILLMEVGSFFEVYGVDNDTEKKGKPKEVAEILNMQLTRKNKTIAKNSVKNPLMAGFPTATFDRYVSRLLQEKKYTIVIVRQKGAPPKVERYLEKILSPGVNFDYTLDHDDNFITSLVIDRHNDIYSAGYAAIDVTTGKNYLFEIHGTREDKTLALDEIFQLLQTHHGAELIITCTDPSTTEEVLNYIEKQGDQNTKVNTKRLKISYQNELFKQTYTIQSFLTPIEFLDLERKPLTTEALALLIEFIVSHDYRVIQNMQHPTMLQADQLLYLGNNPIEQLNIYSNIPQDLTVFSLINNTATSIGRRLLKERLLNPVCNKQTIEKRYDLVEALRPIYTHIDASLKKTYDIERIMRRISIKRLHPFEINFLYETLSATTEIMDKIQTLDINLLPQFLSEKNTLTHCIGHIEKTFDLDQSAKIMTKDIQTSIFQPGFDTELDLLITQKSEQETKLESIRQALLDILESEQGKSEAAYISIKQLDKEGHYLHMTKSRYFLIEQVLKKKYISIDGTVHAFSDFTCKIQKTNVKMTAPIIDTISENIVLLQNRIIALTKELYIKELQTLSTSFGKHFEGLVYFISCIDVAVSTIKSSIKYNFIRPEIVETEQAFFEIETLRHPLVEMREENGIYVPNDVVCGATEHISNQYTNHVIYTENKKDVRGILLYGINSSGKSSLMKSIGVAIILAQAGFFVPAKSMRFKLFKELFTRIVAKDNFEKGLSSFAVEMMELKNIFNRASKHSLILGDEISHGTETLSAISIVSATIERLTEMGSLFMFTTHLHQLNNLPSLKKQHNIARVHLAVRYDEQSDTLIFDRTLQSGSGNSIYGLEFAQSLHMDETFLKNAMTIRKELANDFDTLERLTKKEQSKYHPDLYLATCAICQKHVSDTHHIQPQHAANTEGYIDHVPKNHKYNLLPICKSCHNNIHEGTLDITGFEMTSKGLQLSYKKTG